MTVLLLFPWQCYGLSHSVGDVDVWVNGGREQPPCLEGGDGEALLGGGCKGLGYKDFRHVETLYQT